MTTTQTTTHFFSLPLWRRRGGTPAYSPSNARSTDELGAINPQSSLPSSAQSTLHTRNKELPPTPELSPDNLIPPTRLYPDAHFPHDGDGLASSVGRAAGSMSGKSSRASSVQPASRSSYAPSDSHNPAQPTVALARAALGLGLPHAAPISVSASSSSSEVNTVAFSPPQSPSTADLRPPNFMVRHAKSFHKEPDRAPEDAPPSVTKERRRARGFSLGPLHLMTSDVKGKQRETESSIVADSPEGKSLTRKSSFWSRRRVNSRPDALALPSPTPQPTLPTFPPVSPFDINTPVPSSGLSVLTHKPDLHRRHSERMRKQSARQGDEPPLVEPSPQEPNSTIHARRRRSKRPQTADSPPVAGPRLSFFSEARLFASSPTSSPILTPQEASAPPLPSAPSDPRARAQTNQPILHRLSVNLFGSSSSNTLTPTSTSSPNIPDVATATSPPSSLGSSRPSLSKPSIEIPKPNSEEETPEDYLQRLVEAISKGEVATVLASSADAFHARALRAYIERFNFVGDPLDVAVRKLLMDVGLPRETQQIDRVIEAFAARYVQCNPNLFSSEDHPYILAFSLIMLHTDAFNKSNKRKMTKADYIKNTRLPGVAPEVLDCFYDNIVFAPFIFIEDPLDVNGQRGLVPDAISARRMSTINAPASGGSGSTLLGKSSKIDPYYLITRNLLDDLRVDVHSFIPPESPYRYRGTADSWDEDELQRAFALAGTVELSSVDSRYVSSPWFTLSVSGGPGPVFQSTVGSLPPLTASTWNVKVTKVGLMLRKEDILEGGKRAMSRKWREWCVLLTGSQLMFFRDTTWATHIQAQVSPTDGHLVIPHAALPQPEETYSVRDTIAVFDKTYTKHPHTLRFVLPDRRQFLLQAADEKDMNEWIARINYAGAFKTAGVRMRALGLSNKDIELTGIAAAASHLKDVKHHLGPGHAPSPVIRTWTGRMSEDLDRASRAAETKASEPTRVSGGSEAPRIRQDSGGSVGSDPSTPPFENTSRLFKATFDEVKTELAAVRFQSLDQMSIRSARKRAYSLESTLGSPLASTSAQGNVNTSTKPRLSSTRPEILKSKVEDLESKLSLAQTQLDTDMRFVRNLAVLTPFQRATRDRLQAAVQVVAKRVMQVRLDIEKLACHREVLTTDLAAEERDWQRTKLLAMQAATQKLTDQRKADREAERIAERDEDVRRQELPKLTLSAYVDQTAPATASSPVTIPRRAKMSRGQETSVTDSFQTAQSGGNSAWNGRHRSSTVTFGSPKTFESSYTSAVEMGCSVASNTSLPSPDSPERRRAVPLAAQASLDSTASTDDGAGTIGTHEKFYTAPEMLEEQAEEWNKTRAAKRVSLVKLPSDLRISMLFGKHARDQTSTPEVAEDRSSTPAGSPTLRRRSLSPYEQQSSATVAMLDL
ncbi:hypothetical protein BD310DRAFT_804776 [Dichomitus squalens]|uniref:SEC7 domain-containing protein n=1 Tax=Dichomitus squalens TaxID=114155 RepID=A0A4Q9QBA1_9APHY|nr:hypothetical protein BD310DRAFT_804776 [Dichomitus squalens]